MVELSFTLINGFFMNKTHTGIPVSCIDKQAEQNSKYRRIVALSYNSRYRNRGCPSSNGEAYNSKYLYHEDFFFFIEKHILSTQS